MRHTSKTQDAYIVSLAVSDFLQGLIGYPAEIRNLATKQMQESESAVCRMTGFTVTFLGLVSINHLVFIMVERALIISMPFSSLWTAKKYVGTAIFSSWAIGLVFAFAPLVGWSSYTTEGSKYRCSINWHDPTEIGRRYIYALFAFQFLLPLIIIFCCFGILLYQLKKSNRIFGRFSSTIPSSTTATTSATNKTTRKNKLSVRGKWSTMVCFMTTAFIVSWTPYAVVSFIATNGEESKLPKALVMGAAITAKSSTLINPIIYSLEYNDFRKKVQRFFRKCLDQYEIKRESSTRNVAIVSAPKTTSV